MRSAVSRSRLLLAWLLTIGAATWSTSGLDIHVATTGADDQAGTRAEPVETLVRARDLVRASGRAGKEPCTVWIDEGAYMLAEPLALDTRDSGSAEAPTVYRAVPGQTVRLIGGRSLSAAPALLAGAGIPQIITFLTAWNVFSSNRILVWELPIMGRRFIVARALMTLPVPFVLGTVLWLVGE